MHCNSGFGCFDHGLRESVVAVGPAYAQNIISIFFIEYRPAVSLAPPKKRIDFLSDLRAALQKGASSKGVAAVGKAYAQHVIFCIEGRVAVSLAPNETISTYDQT